MTAIETSSPAADALDELYRGHAAEVYRYAYAVLGNAADAEDVTQTTFVNALRALERGDRPRKPANWLITIAHNIVRQRFRQRKARPAEVELDHDVASAEQSDNDTPSIEELVRALQHIPPTQREALVMRELEGRPSKEIAQILGTSIGALETLLFRARRSLAEELENLVTCDRAEHAISNRQDGRLTRKERRRLDAHLRECPSCARVDAGQFRRRRVFKSLSLLPLPLPLVLFKGAPSASAASGLPTIGAATIGGSTGAVVAGGATAKVAAIVAAVTVAGGAGYEGVQQVRRPDATRPAKSVAVAPAPAARQSLPVVAIPAVAKPRNSPTSGRFGGRAKAAAPGKPTGGKQPVAREESAAQGKSGSGKPLAEWKSVPRGKSTGPGKSETPVTPAARGKPVAAPGQTRTKPTVWGKSTSAAVRATAKLPPGPKAEKPRPAQAGAAKAKSPPTHSPAASKKPSTATEKPSVPAEPAKETKGAKD